MSKGRSDLPNVLGVAEQHPCRRRSEAQRPLDPDRAWLGLLLSPTEGATGDRWVVGELADTQHPAEGVDGCRGKTRFVGVDPIATCTLASPSPADLRWWLAEDKQASG
jgi:hypothetical protein